MIAKGNSYRHAGHGAVQGERRMQDTPSDSRKRRRHEEWLSRGAYVECFCSLDPPVHFPNWPGFPDPCRCGCRKVRYNRSNPENLWHSLSPRWLWEIGFLFPIFRALHNFIWTLPGLIRAIKEVAVSDSPGIKGNEATAPVWFWTKPTVVVLLFLLYVAAWLLSRLTLVVLTPPHVVAMVLVLAFVLLISAQAATRMALSGLVFLIGGAASILYGLSPAIGIALIVAGVGLEYESGRRRDRQNREQIGRLLRIIEHRDGD